MVEIEGKLQPFRINKQDLTELVSLIIQKQIEFGSSMSGIDITVERFKEKCKNLDAMKTFLNDIYLPRVIKEFSLWIWGKPITGLTIYFYFSHMSATYSIQGARDISQAKSIEDTIVQFFRKHATSRICSWVWGLGLGFALLIITLVDTSLMTSSFSIGNISPYGPLYLLIGICSIALIAYILWSSFTENTPSFSFIHSIIYLDHPHNNAVWILIFTIISGIIISLVSRWFG
jgi:hypothetical protein